MVVGERTNRQGSERDLIAKVNSFPPAAHRTALEALGVNGYRRGVLTQFQLEQLLGLSQPQTDDFLAHHVISSSEIDLHQLNAEQWEKELDEWLDELPALPNLPDEAFSRERIYTREDEWRQITNALLE